MSQYVTAPPESDTVHSGLLYYKHKTTFSSNYVLYTGFLLHESTRGAKRIELHSDSTRSPHVICLNPSVSYALGTAKKSKSVPQHKFVVTVGSTKHMFRLSSEEESAKWAEMLNRVTSGPPLEGHTYEFPVTILNTKHAEGLQLNGCYILKVTDTHVLLYSSNGALPTKFQCPLEDVTKVHSSLDATKQPILIINTSSTSPIGEGGFAFTTQAAETISNIISHRHNLVEPPLPPRNKSSSPALRMAASRPLTTSQSSDDILQSNSAVPSNVARAKHTSAGSGQMPRTTSTDMLDMAPLPPLPPPRPPSSLQSDEKASMMVRHSLGGQIPQLGSEFFKGTSPSPHSRSHKLRYSLDHTPPPPVPRSPRPHLHSNSLDISTVHMSESSSGAFSRHQPSTGSSSPHHRDPSLKGSDHTPTPIKKRSVGSPHHGCSSNNGSSSPLSRRLQRQCTLDQVHDDSPVSNGSGLAMAGRFFPSPTTNCRDSSHHRDSRQRVSGEMGEGKAVDSRDGELQRERAVSFKDVEENDFEMVDNWIKDRTSLSSSSTTSLPTPLSPSSTTTPPPPHSTTNSCVPSMSADEAQEPEEFYDYSRRGELSLCTSQTTGGYLKLVA